jgi:GNAT superfamily N-acetyltransferase
MDRAPFAMPDGIALSAEPATGPGPRWVVARAEEELVTRYGFLDTSEGDLRAAVFDPPAGIFLVARAIAPSRAPAPTEPAEPVGGVGLRSLGGRIGEVKRLWVDPAWRGRGVGRTLMAALEDSALELGLSDLELGTGDRQPEAVALYTAAGWEREAADRAGRPLPEWHIRFTRRLQAQHAPVVYTHVYTPLAQTAPPPASDPSPAP